MARNRSEGADLEAMSDSKMGKGSAKSAPRSGGGASASASPNGPTAGGGAPKRGTGTRDSARKPAASTKGAADGAAGNQTSSGSASGGRGRGKTAGAAGGKTTRTRSGADLRKDLRDFASSRPDGWSHDDWLRFLDDLQARGHNINDRDAIGSMLERERLAVALERIPGVGPQRVRNIAERYGYLWRLKETDADQLAREADVPKSVAEKVVAALRS